MEKKSKIQIEYLDIDNLIPYENNPRLNEKAVDVVAKSIKEFGFKNPIIIDSMNTIIAGHTRLLASRKLGLKEVPIIRVEDLNKEQIRAFRIADNKTAEFSMWDEDLLKIELEGLEGIFTGFDEGYFDEDLENPYTKKVEIPTYEPTEEQAPPLGVLVNEEKTLELENKILMSNVSSENKEFLLKASKRHLQFNYANIAEYYAHADIEMQELMEQSALVIIDYQDAISNGYVKLSKGIEDLMAEDE